MVILFILRLIPKHDDDESSQLRIQIKINSRLDFWFFELKNDEEELLFFSKSILHFK